MTAFFLYLGASSAFAGAPLPDPVLINGAAYIPVGLFSQSKGLQYQWDPLLKNATVSGAAGVVKFHVGSEYLLSRGKVHKLKDKVRLFNGFVAAPLSAGEHLEGLVSANLALTHRIRRVVIDAGHGGHDFGAQSRGGAREKDIVLQVARMVRGELEKCGIEVIMTRNSDVFIPLSERARVANQNHADFFVSIHANASYSKSLQGFEVYYLSEATDDQAMALQRAENSVLRFESGRMQVPTAGLKAIYWDLKETQNRKESIKIADFMADAVESSVDIANRRIKSANFYVLRWSECPAVLVEMGYLTNREDEARLKDPNYRERLAAAIVRGLMNYKAEFERTDGYSR